MFSKEWDFYIRNLMAMLGCGFTWTEVGEENED